FVPDLLAEGLPAPDFPAAALVEPPPPFPSPAPLPARLPAELFFAAVPDVFRAHFPPPSEWASAESVAIGAPDGGMVQRTDHERCHYARLTPSARSTGATKGTTGSCFGGNSVRHNRRSIHEHPVNSARKSL